MTGLLFPILRNYLEFAEMFLRSVTAFGLILNTVSRERESNPVFSRTPQEVTNHAHANAPCHTLPVSVILCVRLTTFENVVLRLLLFSYTICIALMNYTPS